MNKPQSLRHALNKAVPYVRNNPDKLHLFVDNGSLVATGASSMSWEYRYTLNAVIEDFSGDQNLLMAPVLLWLRDNQPDAINNPALREKLFTFEVDILRNDVCDISLNRTSTRRSTACQVIFLPFRQPCSTSPPRCSAGSITLTAVMQASSCT